ncbi:MAG: type I methionyl aminopeptidase [Candidatus Cloacimonetes bacterium]|jgi:methionyl aminopeptidase|nr:type I methionyl aminopeptidase [Candidatus Cloacimonadota bacterium]
MIYQKSPAEIDKIRTASMVIAELFDELRKMIEPGISTLELDGFAESYIRDRGGRPAFKGYQIPGLKPFPGTLCTSINDCIVHGIPSRKAILKEGDLIGIDVGVVKDGYYGDAARSFAVGEVSEEAIRLMQITEQALARGIDAARAGNRVGDISHAIGSYILEQGYFAADNLTGHGVGRQLHEEPQIPNTGRAGYGPRLMPGMTLAIEPMVNIGTNRVKEKGWEFFTADGSLSAHFEHTIAITDADALILSKA